MVPLQEMIATLDRLGDEMRAEAADLEQRALDLDEIKRALLAREAQAAPAA